MLTKKFLQNLDENLKKTYCVTDIETTGQKPEESEIIEIASIKVKDGKIIDRFSSFVKPERSIPPFITKITGIKNEDVAFAPVMDSVLKEWIDFIKGSDYFCAHNVMFDYEFIYRNLGICKIPRENLEQLKFFCTVKAGRILFPNLPSRKLEDLITYFDIKVENRHRALDDALATVQILSTYFEELIKKKDILIESIEKSQNEKIKTFEAAEYLSVTKEKIYDMIKSRELKVAETYTTKNGYEGYLFYRRDVEKLV